MTAPTDFDDLVRDALAARANTAVETTEPYARVHTAVRRDRRRRLVVGGSSGALALALAVGVAAQLLPSGPTAAPLATQTTTTASPTTAPPLSSWPARGNLASDTALTQALLAHHDAVLYAADEADRRIAVTYDRHENQVTAYAGPVGAELPAPEGAATTETLTPLGHGVAVGDAGDAAQVVSVAMTADTRSDLLVLAWPSAQEAEVSTLAMPNPLGGVTRQFHLMTLTDGVGWTRTADTGGQTVRLRVGRAYDGPVTVIGAPERDGPSRCLDCTDISTGDLAVVRDEVASLYGFEPGHVQAEVLTDAHMPLAVDGDTGLARVTVVAAEADGHHFLAYAARYGGTGYRELTSGLPVPVPAKWHVNNPLVLNASTASDETAAKLVIAAGANRVDWNVATYHGTAKINDQGFAVIQYPRSAAESPLRVATYNAQGNALGGYDSSTAVDFSDPLDVYPDR